MTTLSRFGVLAFFPALLAAQETGSFTIHEILHTVGEEHYEIKPGPEGGSQVMNSSFTYTDRANTRTVSVDLVMKRDLSPLSFEIKGRPTGLTAIGAGQAVVREGDAERNIALPPHYFVGLGYTPFSVQQMMMRYWLGHGKPARLTILRANPAAADVRIEPVGNDSFSVAGKRVTLNRYTVDNLVFGREIVWMNPENQLAAVMTFAAGLPMEGIRTEYEPVFQDLFRAGVAQEMANLKSLESQVPVEHSGNFAIVGATLVDATGHAPVLDSVVIIRNGRIAAAGARSQVPVPNGMPAVNANGKTLLPGLWEMHTHFSGIEFGPGYLAAGVTTARDCGGEFDFLVAARDAIAKRGMGPRLLLAGLVDASGPTGFGNVFADTPEEARAVVARYHAANFEQIKLYTYLKPDVIAALAAEAHRVGMSVTGHVPAALNAFQGVEAGMDQINHLNYVSQMMRSPGGGRGAAIEFDSQTAAKAVQFFKDHHTVVDPTASWGEMAGHPATTDIATFEPGIVKAPYTVASKFLTLGAGVDAERFKARMIESVAVIRALHKAGVTIVPGSDTGLVGYGLLRELEIYVQAGMTPLEAIQSATIVSARAMKLDADSGTIEAGKRADLILVDGDPLANISDIRKVSNVVANGRMYSSAKLWQSIGFRP